MKEKENNQTMQNLVQETEQKPVLEIKNLSVLIKERFLVKNVNFKMYKGDCFGIIGEDKSGKTSLLKAICGSMPIGPGQVFVDGKDIYRNLKSLANVSECLDPPVFFKYQTVYENLKYLSMLNESLDKEKIIRVLNRFNLAHKLNTRVLFLSFYEKKLMALALAFLAEPTLILLDEPFRDIPEESLQMVKDAINEIRAKGTTIILTSRKLEDLDGLCNQYIFMENREIVRIMSQEECDKLTDLKTYAFVKVKYPHYAGKLIKDNFNLAVKLLDLRVLFEADEDTVAKIVQFLTKHKIAIYRAGYLSRKAEKIFAELTPYYKEEKA